MKITSNPFVSSKSAKSFIQKRKLTKKCVSYLVHVWEVSWKCLGYAWDVLQSLEEEVGEVFSESGRLKDGSPTCSLPYQRFENHDLPTSALEIQSEDKIKSSVSKPEEKLKPIPDNTFKSLDELSEDVPVSLPKDI